MTRKNLHAICLFAATLFNTQPASAGICDLEEFSTHKDLIVRVGSFLGLSLEQAEQIFVNGEDFPEMISSLQYHDYIKALPESTLNQLADGILSPKYSTPQSLLNPSVLLRKIRYRNVRLMTSRLVKPRARLVDDTFAQSSQELPREIRPLLIDSLLPYPAFGEIVPNLSEKAVKSVAVAVRNRLSTKERNTLASELVDAVPGLFRLPESIQNDPWTRNKVVKATSKETLDLFGVDLLFNILSRRTSNTQAFSNPSVLDIYLNDVRRGYFYGGQTSVRIDHYIRSILAEWFDKKNLNANLSGKSLRGDIIRDIKASLSGIIERNPIQQAEKPRETITKSQTMAPRTNTVSQIARPVPITSKRRRKQIQQKENPKPDEESEDKPAVDHVALTRKMSPSDKVNFILGYCPTESIKKEFESFFTPNEEQNLNEISFALAKYLDNIDRKSAVVNTQVADIHEIKTSSTVRVAVFLGKGENIALLAIDKVKNGGSGNSQTKFLQNARNRIP